MRVSAVPDLRKDGTSHTAMHDAVVTCLRVYAIAAGISAVIAVTIKLIAFLLNRAGGD